MNNSISNNSHFRVLKAVLPVAGFGTRMLPASKAIPKELLPIVDKPLIQYVVSEAVAAGIKEIVLVTHSSKNAIENHFDSNFELEASLEAKGKTSLLQEIQTIIPDDVSIIAVRQPKPLGLGHAVLAARPVIGNNPFAVLLPDVIIDQYQSDLKSDNLADMIAKFEQSGSNQIMVEPVPPQQVNQYGVVDLHGVELAQGDCAEIFDMVEKPPVDQAPSNLAITGRYVLSAKIWGLLEATTPGAGGEIQLTDALHKLRAIETMQAYRLKGASHDCGSKLGYLMANVEYGLRNEEFGEEFRKELKKMLGAS